jgi:hypothetical protein
MAEVKKDRYVVSEIAGRYVCGKRVKPGQVLDLTPRQAKYELDLGALVHPDAKPKPEVRKKG